jgi:hypothetical protein
MHTNTSGDGRVFQPRTIIMMGKGFYLESDSWISTRQCEVSPAWSRYELPKLGIAG